MLPSLKTTNAIARAEQWFWLVLLTCGVLTVLIQAFLRLLG
jgi:hypothetical protein